MCSGKRKGFTLVELLVVIAIIGMLMALLFPAVQAARETGRGNTCRNNMRNLAIAVYQYDNRKGFYPGNSEFVKPSNAPATSTAYLQRSLFYSLFPDLERNDLYELYSPDNVNNHLGAMSGLPYIDLFVCPSNPIRTGSPCAYGTTVPYWADYNSNFWQILPFAGLFFYNTAVGPSQLNTNGSSAYVGANDGAATTVLMAENLDATGWQYGIGWNVGWNQYWGRLITVGDHNPTNQRLYYKINAQNKGTMGETAVAAPAGWQRMRPSSNHPQSVNMSFADTHVRAIRDSIAYRVYAHLITPFGADQRRWNTSYPTIISAQNVNLWTQALNESEL